MIDISARITNELPVVKISDDLVITINNRKSSVLSVQAMIAEAGNNEKDGKEVNELKFMDSVLRCLTSGKTVDAINKLDLPLPEYKVIYNAIMAACNGQTLEEFEQQQKARFQK